jgi:hypothetical protein
MNTRGIGNVTEAKILAALVQAGYLVSYPIGSGHRYDLVIDDGKHLSRVQCKTGRVRDGSLIFNGYSMPGNGVRRQSYKGVADLFAVLNPEDERIYLIPVGEVGESDVSLRLVPTGNGQSRRLRWAAGYLLTSLKADAISGEPFQESREPTMHE